MGEAGRRIFNSEFDMTGQILIGCENRMKLTQASKPKEAEESTTMNQSHWTWSAPGLQTESSESPGRSRKGDAPESVTDVPVCPANLWVRGRGRAKGGIWCSSGNEIYGDPRDPSGVYSKECKINKRNSLKNKNKNNSFSCMKIFSLLLNRVKWTTSNGTEPSWPENSRRQELHSELQLQRKHFGFFPMIEAGSWGKSPHSDRHAIKWEGEDQWKIQSQS